MRAPSSLRRAKIAVPILCILVVLVATLLAPLLAPFHPNDVGVGLSLSAPSMAHPLGTDATGRDCLSRLLYGGRVSLPIGAVAVLSAVLVGTTLGGLAGFARGPLDTLIVWFTDLFLSLPRLVLLLAIFGILRLLPMNGGGDEALTRILTIGLILGLTGWMGVARLVRAQLLSLREREFILATRALGVPEWRILVRHLLPNAMAPVVVHATLMMGTAILTEASLSFLGLGLSAPTATWGQMVSTGLRFPTMTWLTLYPGLTIVFTVTAFNLLGDALRDALDPRMERSL